MALSLGVRLLHLAHVGPSCYHARMSDRTNVRVHGTVLAELRELQAHCTEITGVRPSLSSLLERVVRDGATQLRARLPRVVAVDTAPKAGT